MTGLATPAATGGLLAQYDGMAALAGRYDGFLIDLWGVLHDGFRPYPGAIEALTALRAAGKRIVLLSNAPRPAAASAARLTELGFAPTLYDAVITSGEDAWRHLVRRDDPWYAALGRKLYLLGMPKDYGMLEGIAFDRVADPGDADVMLNTGADFGQTVADYEDLLSLAAGRGLPMICANPDLDVIYGGRREICAGALAARYQELGGQVRYHGKPHPGVYRLCFAELADIARDRILAIGDSLRTDLAGAAAAGIDAVLITGGIHAEVLGLEAGAGMSADPVRLAELCATQGQRPVAALPAFRW